jgi:hypothetical protein
VSRPPPSLPSAPIYSTDYPPMRIPSVGRGDLDPLQGTRGGAGTGSLVGEHLSFPSSLSPFSLPPLFLPLSPLSLPSLSLPPLTSLSPVTCDCSPIGPDHPMFWGGGERGAAERDPYYPFPGGGFDPMGGMPRFDPINPLPGGGAEPMGGRNFGGRGRGRGRNARRFPGEPNPDHMQPPGFNDDDMYS